jgi:hypothetical protein
MANTPRHIRIFLSSPGDVAEERAIAREIIEQLPYDPMLRDKLTIDLVAWDKPGAGTPMLANMTPQEAINSGLPKPSGCNIVVVIFWARMGTPLPHPDYKKPDGSPYLSGTEWEYLNAIAAAEDTGKPLVVIYRRSEKILLDPDDPDFDNKLTQKRRVDGFFKSFRDEDGAIRRGANGYADPDDFKNKFAHDLRALVVRLIGQPLETDTTMPELAGGGQQVIDSSNVVQVGSVGGDLTVIQQSAKPDTPDPAEARAYLNWLHSTSMESGLLRVLDPNTKNVATSRQPVTVDQVYTALDTRTAIYRDETGCVDWQAVALEGAQYKYREQEQHLERLREEGKFSLLTALEAANHYDKLVLLGDPGSGKSTFVNYLALCLSGHYLDPAHGWLDRLTEHGWAHDVRLPVVITLRDFAQDMPPDAECGEAHFLWDHIARQLEKHAATASLPFVQHQMQAGQALILLDGLDEVPPDRRECMRDTLADFMRAHPDNRYLITCRILSYTHDAWHIPATHAETLASFDRDKVHHFVKAWYTASTAVGNIDHELAETRIHDLTGALDHPHLHDMASNPMLLTVMALVHNHTGALPRESARLYDECVKLLMFRWRPHNARALVDQLAVREDTIYRALWQVAYQAHDKQAERKGTADISEADIVFLLRDSLGGMDQASEFCEYVEKHAGLLIGRGQDDSGARIFTFPHRTFQEYLAGCHISTGRFSREVLRLAQRGDMWREPLLLATGNLIFNQQNITTPLDAINALLVREPETGDNWRAIWLAGEMLQLVGVANAEGDEVGRDVLPLARNRLAALASGGHLDPVERAAAGETLGWLGDPRPGVGLDENGLPDIAWCQIPGGTIEIKDQPFKVEPFHIAQYTVTWQQYQAFIEDGGYTTDTWWNEPRRIKPQDAEWSIPNHPRERVSWYEAMAFCRWLSEKLGYEVRLPTEMEWQQTATGGNPANTYPWGTEYISGYANIDETYNDVGPHFLQQTTAVGLYPQGASEQDVLDLSGNVLEWCLNTYDDPQNTDPGGTDTRVVRGGSFGNSLRLARCAFRGSLTPDARNDRRGFRVVCSHVPG